MTRIRRVLLLLMLSTVAALGLASAAQAAGTVTINPSVPSYTGGDGTGQWRDHWTMTSSGFGPNTGDPYYSIQVQSQTFLYVGDTGASYWQSGEPKCSTYYCRSTNDYDWNRADLGDGFAMGQGTWEMDGTTMNIAAGACPYSGFHWFGAVVLYRYRIKPDGSTTFGAWTAWQWSPVSAGQYAQVCL